MNDFHDDEDDSTNLVYVDGNYVAAQNTETLAHGQPRLRQKWRATIDDDTAVPVSTETNVLTDEPPEPTEENGLDLPRNVSDDEARRQRKAALKSAKLEPDSKLLIASGARREPREREPRQVESWHIMEQIERGTFCDHRGTKSRLKDTLRRLKNDLAVVDALAFDDGIQRDKDRVVFEGAMTIERQTRRNKVRPEDGQSEARYDGAPRKVGKVPVVEMQDEFNITNARLTLEEIEASLGPLWRILRDAICDNLKLEEVGNTFGKTHKQASAVGAVIIDLALSAAAEVYDRIDDREQSELTYIDWLESQPDSLPIPARKLKRAYRQKPNRLTFQQNAAIKADLFAANDNHARSMAA